MPSSAAGIGGCGWGPFGGRPNRFVDSTMSGGDSVWVLLDLMSPTVGAHLHQDGDVIDSRDWRGRFCSFMFSISPTTSMVASRDRSPDPANTTPNGFPGLFSAATNHVGCGIGQTMVADASLVAACSTPFQLSNGVTTSLGTTTLGIVCDSTTGALKLFTGGGNPRCIIVARLDFSAPFAATL